MENAPPRPAPPTNHHVLQRMELRLLKTLRWGLDRAGFPTGRRRKSHLILPGDHPVGVRLSYYTSDPRWWRITYGGVFFEGDGYYRYPVLFENRELTLHLDEVTEEIGIQLGRQIREPDWLWPLFSHDSSYPRYAWSEKAWSTYQAESQIRKNWRKWCEERRAGR